LHTLPELAIYYTIQAQAMSQIQTAHIKTPCLSPNLNTDFSSLFCKSMTFCLNVPVGDMEKLYLSQNSIIRTMTRYIQNAL